MTNYNVASTGQLAQASDVGVSLDAEGSFPLHLQRQCVERIIRRKAGVRPNDKMVVGTSQRYEAAEDF